LDQREFAFGHLWILIAEHFELDVGDEVSQRDGQVLYEVPRAEKAYLLGAAAGEENGTFRA
jgi:hypothetical protein